MNEKKYFIYLDILGFERLAKDIAEKKGIESRKVREDFLNVIKERVEATERKGGIIGKNYGRKDDWLLVTDSLDKISKNILEILSHNTMYEDYERIPLEIAVGTAEFDKWAKFEGEKLIIEETTIEFLTTYIVNHYRKWYKDHHNGQRVKSTFIIFTESVYQELEPLDRKICREIKYKQNEKHIKFFLADVNRVQQRGRVFEFLEKIGHGGSKWYDRIDYVYVPPLEYEDIKRTLEEKRIVFITGTQEYGKTYTAVRLMWEYYNRGYKPRWIRGGEKDERTKVREKLENIRADLKSGYIIYFEDPFGKTQYEGREDLEREIGTIIDTAKQVEDAYVLITSREEVFKEFEKEKLSAKELKEFENKLNIRKPSYNYKKRKKILLRWAEEENCNWFGNEELRNLVFNSIKDEKILPTPLSIKSFVIVTTNIKKEDELKEKIKQKSEETEKAFAKEIKNMTDDKILFLSFLFISSSFNVGFVRVTYQELVGELNLENAWEFDRVLNWFKDDKVKIVIKRLEFSHPSYSKSLRHLLVKDGYITEINEKIFSKLLFKLSEENEAVRYVARAVAANFDELPEDVRNKLLLKLSKRYKAAGPVARAVAKNFDKLPEDVRNLLFKLSTNPWTAGPVARAVVKNFDKLPEDVRNLLFKLSTNPWTAGPVARAVTENFDKLPEDVRNKLLLKLSEKDKAAGPVARAVAGNFDKLPEDVRNKLLLDVFEKSKGAWAIAKSVAENFNKLPEDVRNLLFKLSENDEAAGPVAWALGENFDRLPGDVRNKLLLKLSEKDKAARPVARVVTENFNKLPEDVRNLLFKLSEKDRAPRPVAKYVAANFDKLPEDVRNLLDGLQKPLQQVIRTLSKSGAGEQALHLVSHASPKIDLDFISKILNELSRCKNETVKIKAAQMLKVIFDDSKGNKEC